MRVSGNGIGYSCAPSALSREIASLFGRDDHSRGGDAPGRRRHRRRSLRIEPLESRHMMDAATSVSAAWFAVVADDMDVEHAAAAQWTAEDTIVEAVNDSATTDSTLYDWIVQFDAGALDGIASAAETISLLTGGGVDFQILRGLGLAGMVLVRSSGSSINDVENCLAGNVYVASYEQDAYREADENAASSISTESAWESAAIDLEEAWTITTGSTSVVVAVIDTGVDYNHVALTNNIWVNPGEIAGNGIDDDGNGFIDDVYGYDFANGDGNPMDDNGHGTHVSGTIISASNASVMALKFLGSDGSGYLSDALAAINYATMMRDQYGVNVRVDNNSWGGGGFSSAMQSAIAAANGSGILFVAAAGNNAANNDATAQYPANYALPNVISVAASTQTNALASFSNYGATTVDLAAPGVSIVSTTPNNTYSTYSGTSMAAPHVSAVAALAWTLCPDAAVAEVRDAIFDGAASVGSLAGKVATGGVLNAYDTLSILADSGVDTAPVVGSLSLSSNSISAGATVVLTANGIAATTGSITAVRFVLDANGNGHYDAGDAILGTSTTVVGGASSLAINTAGYASGTHTILAAAQNSEGQWSSWVAATLNVVPPDDHGNSAATATAINGVSSSTSGRIGENGDADWFSFEAVAGKTYVFTVTLGTLADSVLYLYGTNGTAQLAANDDYGSTCGSKITWTAASSGIHYLKVTGYGDAYTGTYTLGATRVNSAPMLAAIGSQTMAYSQTTIAIDLAATDADGDSLTYTAAATAIDPLEQKAYNLDRQYNLHTFANGSYYTNARGRSEKYLLGTNRVLYYILPSGALYRLNGGMAKSVYIDALSPAYYADPSLLHAATSPSLSAVDASFVSVTVSGNTLTITRAAGYTGGVCVTVRVSDGAASDSETFTVADPLAAKAYNLDQRLGLRAFVSGSYYQNARGANEKYMLAPGNVMYYLLPDGSLYRFKGSIAKSVPVAKLSAAYYANPALLHDAYSPALAAAAARAANNASGFVFVDKGTGRTGIEAAASANRLLERTGAVLAWLALDDNGPSPLSGSTLENAASTFATTFSASLESTTSDRRTASLHDEVLARFGEKDISVAQDSAAFSRMDLNRVEFNLDESGDEAATDPFGLRIGSRDRSAIDRVFGLPAEALAPSSAWSLRG